MTTWHGWALALRLGLIVVVICVATMRHLTQTPVARRKGLTHTVMVLLVLGLGWYLGARR